QRAVHLKSAVCGRTAGVDHPFRDALVVEARDLLAQVEVLDERGATCAGAERVVGLRDADALVGREGGSCRVTAEILKLNGFAVLRIAVGAPRSGRVRVVFAG